MSHRYSLAVRKLALRAAEAAHATWFTMSRFQHGATNAAARKDRAMRIWDRAARRV